MQRIDSLQSAPPSRPARDHSTLMNKFILPSLLVLCGTSALNLSTAAPFGDLTVNGDFETGDTSSWTSFPTASSSFAVTSDANSGSWAGEIHNSAGTSAHVVKQANIGIGTVTPGATIDISFAAKGVGVLGGVAFAELFSEISGGGVSSAVLLGGAPIAVTGSWQTFNYTATAGGDVSGGITLQFAVVTGADIGSEMELFIDDVTVMSTTNVIELSSYTEDFELLNMADGGALAAAGWLVFANVFDSNGGYLYGYGPFGAPNGGPGFSAITTGEGGPAQGTQQLVTYSDYNNGDHGNGNTIESNVFREQIIGATDVGKTFTFQFDAKLGDLVPNSTASAFIKVIDNQVFSLDGYSFVDTTNLPTTWGTHSISLTIDANHVGDFFQTGFQTNATNFTASGIIYDNIVFGEDTGLGNSYCSSTANSTGGAAVISASGSKSVTANDLVLSASPAPEGEFGIFYYGANQISSAFGNGTRCVGGANLARYSVGTITGGALTHAADHTMPPYAAVAITSGSTWNFQAWFRDPSAGGAAFDLSDGLELTFQP
ncbi:MAG: hypothetical protein ACI841_004771 [Planctomycetota bacterium]|jgi:hypothetical protein